MADVIDRQDLQLLEGAARGDIRAVKEAVSGGANIQVAQAEGLTALHIAVALNDLPLARYLIEEAGAPFVPDGFGRLPTVVAAQCLASEELAEYIFEREAAALSDPK